MQEEWNWGYHEAVIHMKLSLSLLKLLKSCRKACMYQYQRGFLTQFPILYPSTLPHRKNKRIFLIPIEILIIWLGLNETTFQTRFLHNHKQLKHWFLKEKIGIGYIWKTNKVSFSQIRMLFYDVECFLNEDLVFFLIRREYLWREGSKYCTSCKKTHLRSSTLASPSGSNSDEITFTSFNQMQMNHNSSQTSMI